MISIPQQELTRFDALKFADYNPREMADSELAKLQASLREFGFVEPVVARREDGLVIGGHQRLTAFARLCQDADIDPAPQKVPTVFLEGVSDDRAKLLNLALNKIHGEWNYEKLAEVLSSIDTTIVDIELSGFMVPEIEDIKLLMGPHEHGEEPRTEGELEGDALDEAIARKLRRFVFEPETDEEAAMCREALQVCGQTSIKDGDAAFVELCRRVLAQGSE